MSKLKHMNSELFYCFLGAVIGLIPSIILYYFKIIKKNRQNKKSYSQVINYPYENDILIPLHSWSFNHPLLPKKTKIIQEERSDSHEFIRDQEEFDSYVDTFKSQNYTGEISYCVGYNVDHQDNKYGDNFELKVANCDYSEALASGKYLTTHPDVRERIRNIVNADPQAYFQKAIPSDIFLNLIVVSEYGNLLLLRRSKSVASARGLWCVGAYETMEQYHASTAHGDPDFHALAQRCLEEELAISQIEKDADNRIVQRYKSIFISSISLSLSHAGLLVTGIVRLENITEGEVIQRISKSAHSKYEHDDVRWIPFNHREIKKFVEKGTGLYDNFVTSTNEKWIGYAKWSLYECARVYDYDNVLMS